MVHWIIGDDDDDDDDDDHHHHHHHHHHNPSFSERLRQSPEALRRFTKIGEDQASQAYSRTLIEVLRIFFEILTIMEYQARCSLPEETVNKDVNSMFLRVLLTSNHMITLVQFGIIKHLFNFSRLQIALASIYSCLFIQNCTQNEVITYT